MIEGHISEERFEDFVREEPDPEETVHLERCMPCQNRLAFIKRFRVTLAVEMQHPMTRAAEDFARTLGGISVIEMHPFKAEPDQRPLGAGSHTMILAAYGETQRGTSDTRKSMTFASEPDGVMIRLVHVAGKKWECYVLSEIRANRDHVLLTLEAPGMTPIRVFTDRDGAAALEERDSLVWEKCIFALHLPVKSVPAAALLQQEGDVEKNLHVVRSGGQLVCNPLLEPPEPLRFAGFIMKDGTAALKDIVAGELTISESYAGDVSELRFFC